MGQWWKIIDLTTVTGVERLTKLGESFWEEHRALVEALLLPRFPPCPHALTHSTHSAPTPRKTKYRTITDLPVELIEIIFEHITSFSDAFTLGAVDYGLWNCGESYIKRLYVGDHSVHAGNSLICLGDYAKDLPDAISSQTHLDRYVQLIEEGFSPFNDNWAEYDDFEPEDEQEIPTIAEQLYRRAWFVCRPWRPHTKAERQLWVHVPVEHLRRLYPDAEHLRWPDAEHLRWLYPDLLDGNVWVARNLTKNLYLRSDTLSVLGGDTNLGFGRAILSRICWSTDGTTSMPWDGDIHRGVWAGDCFDIVPLSSHEKEVELLKTEWTDCTDEVREEMIAIWQSGFGDEEEPW